MAFQIDPRIPLEALANPINIGESLTKAQENQLRLQALRDEYNAAKEEKLRQKQMRSGIQTDIEQIQRGIPAQYSPLQYQQTPQTGQMPYGMTGVLANERGQNMPQPKVFGEDILAGNFNLSGGDVTQQAQEGRQPTPEEYVQILAKQAMMHGDEKAGFEALKLAAELKKAKQKDAAKWGMNPTKGINEKGEPDYFVVNELGQKQFLGVNPYESPKDKKPTPVMVNGVPKTVKVPNTNDVKILMSDGTLMSGGSITKPEPLEDSTNSFTPAAIDAAAARYNIDGTLPPMGMGGSAARSQILNRAAELSAGVSGTDQRVSQLTTKAITSTLLQLKKQKTMIQAFEEMANKNADIALEISEQVDRTGMPVLNRWILAGRNKIQGDPATATFNTAVNVFANEYAKIMSGSMSNTPVSDSARKEAHDILNTAQTPAQLKANIKLLQREMKNRIIGLDDAERLLINQMKGAKIDSHEGKIDKKADYMEYKKERDKAYKSGNYDLVRKLDAMAKQDGLTK